MTRHTGALQLSLPLFQGRMDQLLLDLEQHKLSVVDLPLAQVVDQIAVFMHEETDVDLDSAGEMLVSTARLLAAKSRLLLRDPAEPAEVEELPDTVEHVLRYAMGDARAFLAGRAGEEAFPAPSRLGSLSRPMEAQSAFVLARAWGEMRGRVIKEAVRVVVPTFMRLEVAVGSLVKRLLTGHPVRFGQIRAESGTRDTVVHFLAVLELVRRRQIVVEQVELFGDIVMIWSDSEEERGSRAG